MTTLEVVDLFSGLGGFSQAFVDRGHTVERYDFNEKFKDIPHTMIKDVLEMSSVDLKHANIILASPPCTHFSYAAVTKGSHLHWPKGIPTKETKQQIELVKYTVSIILETDPEYWILENPRGFMKKVLGQPAIETYWSAWGAPTLKPTHLWGKFPPIDWKVPLSTQKNEWGKAMPRDPALRALIPYEFSMAVCLATEGNSPQTTLEETQE